MLYYTMSRSQKQSTNVYPKEDQWALLIQMATALKPLQVATTALCEAEIVSVLLVYPIITSLITKHLVINGEDLAAVKSSKILLEMT